VKVLNNSDLFSAIRQRVAWSRERVFIGVSIDESTVNRIERDSQSPRPLTMGKLADATGQHMHTLEVSLLDSQPLSVYEMCEALAHAFDNDDDENASDILALIESREGMDTPFNQHFLLAQRARLLTLVGENTKSIRVTVENGLAITNLGLDNLEGKPLILHEPQLLLDLAQAYGRDGDHAGAVKLLNDVLYGLERYPQDDKSKEQIIAPILLAMSKIQLDATGYSASMETCDKGFGVSVRRHRGKHCPDFLYVKALSLYGKNGNAPCDESRFMLIKAYCGFVTTNKQKEALALVETASGKFGFNPNLYGAERLVAVGAAKSHYRMNLSGGLMVKTLGDFIHALRKTSGIPLDVLSKGICNTSTLSRIEKNKIERPDFYTVEAIGQRLGVNIGKFFSFYLSATDFEGVQIRDKVQAMLRHKKHGEVPRLLAELGTRRSYKSGVCLQFIKSAESTMYGAHSRTDAEFLKMVENALRITIPDFDADNIRGYRLTLEEATLINKMGNHYLQANEKMRAARIYQDLLANITSNWKDEVLLGRLFAIVSFNLSTCLGRMGERKHALEVIQRALDFEQSHDRLIRLGDLFYNKAYIEKELGDTKKESLPFFVLSFYMACIFSEFGQGELVEPTRVRIKEHFSIEL